MQFIMYLMVDKKHEDKLFEGWYENIGPDTELFCFEIFIFFTLMILMNAKPPIGVNRLILSEY